MREMAPTHFSAEGIPAGEGKPGGGSKNGCNKPKSKKPSLSTLNMKLGFSPPSGR
jgi:hypothetical protein